MYNYNDEQLTKVELSCARVRVHGYTEVKQGIVCVRGMLSRWHCHVSSISPPSSEPAAELVLLTYTTYVTCGVGYSTLTSDEFCEKAFSIG
jgi:hypothetical protein